MTIVKLPLAGSVVDHNGQRIAYKLSRDPDDDSRWNCALDPHKVDQFTIAGSGKTHAEAVRAARQWWRDFDKP